LFRATRDAVRGSSLRSVNANRRVRVCGGPTHNLDHTLADIANVNLIKATIPTVSLPEEKASDSHDYGDYCEAGEAHRTAFGQGRNNKATQQ
jgi:hypothetical protein